MSDQTGDHISPELAEAFSWAVYHYRHVWTPGTPEITRKLSNGSFTMIGVCDLVDKFTDPLPDGLFDILRSETHLGTDVSALDADRTYRGGARHLRLLIDAKKEAARKREELRRNR